VTVDPVVALAAHSLAPGQVRLGVRVRHTVGAGAAAASAWWFLAAEGSHRYRLAAVTPARETAAGITSASAIVAPPSPQFDYFLCMSPSWENAMGPASTHRQCPRADFSSSSPPLGGYRGEARGTPLATFPSAGAIAGAERFLQARAGRTSFAVLDSSGQLSGVHLREHFQTASVIKVMFLTAYLQRLAALHRGLSAADNALLYPMIHISDNEAASAVLAVIGEGAVERVAREAGMSDYAPGVGWWAYSQTSAADQVRLMLALERLIPTQFYPYARGLMAGIEPEQSWGFPPVARPRWQVFFKTGALPSEGLFNEVALLERPGLKIAVAVLTDGDPSMAYGEETIEGLASILLEGTP
jgi:beta-lactamase family protein